MCKYNVRSVKKDDLQLIKVLIDNYEFKPYSEYSFVSQTQLYKYIQYQVIDFLNQKNNIAILVEEGVKPLGFGCFNILTWDSQILDIKMARLLYLISKENKLILKKHLLSYILTESLNRNIKYLTCRINTRDFSILHLLGHHQFVVDEVLVKLSFNFKQNLTKDYELTCNIQEYHDKYFESIKEITYDNYANRLLFDPKFSEQKIRKLYSKWAENCCKGRSDKIFVAERENKCVGFIACNILKSPSEIFDKKIGFIDLIIVDRYSQGLGIGYALLYAALNWFSNMVDIVELGVRVDNYPALNMYQKAGFKVISSNFTLHKWL
ncbi:MAG: GNAT family N-acetyltransferase [Candidatus Hodarchaeota archaeon]